MDTKLTFYLIHHSHTDIGYTHYQEKLEKYHIYYIKETIDILNAAYRGKHPEWKDFKWVCESLWAVENFLKVASKEYKEDFFQYVRQGNIGLSGCYLNFNEIVDAATLHTVVSKALLPLHDEGISVRSSMTADINGYSWGYADILADFGVENLLSFVHTHHGYHPIFEKQMAFYWQAPSGRKILAWNGDHYQIGNMLGMSQMPMAEDSTEFLTVVENIGKFKQELLDAGYSYDFIPVGIHGRMGDNSFPGAQVMDFVNQYNALPDRAVTLKMATLDDFFERLRQEDDIPTLEGDWTDWWADGAGSTPVVVQHYREAVSKYHLADMLDPKREIVSQEMFDQIAADAVMYSEHTWGHHRSVGEPWDRGVNKFDLRKSLFAQRANESASRAVDAISWHYGETPMSTNSGFAFYALNPYGEEITTMLTYSQESLFAFQDGAFEVIDSDTNLVVPHQQGSSSAGIDINIHVTLPPKAKKKYQLRHAEQPVVPSEAMVARRGAERVQDIGFILDTLLEEDGKVVSPYRLENQFFKMEYDNKQGIHTLYDKKNKVSLLREGATHGAFQPVYEVTPATAGGQWAVRSTMGRNRRSYTTQQYAGEITDIRVLDNGPLFSKLEFQYKMEGTEFCSILLTIFHEVPRIQCDLRLHKTSVWSPENLYVSLPFTTGDTEEFWIEKTNAVLRPRIDQLPGTLIDFYSVQNGMSFVADNRSLTIALQDNPLVWMGELVPQEIRMHGENDENIAPVYSWVMNNYWETNFKVDLGGFQQYSYTLELVETGSAHAAIDKTRQNNTPPLTFISFTEDSRLE